LLIAGCTSSETESENANIQTLSIVVNGWNFSADLSDQWHVSSQSPENADFAGWDSRGEEYTDDLFIRQAKSVDDDPNWLNWKGVILSDAFWLPPKDDANADPLASVEIMVYKVPEEIRNWEAQDIFMDLNGPIGNAASSDDADFNGRPALLIKKDYEETENDEGKVIIPESSTCSIDVLITDDTVVSIYVQTLPESNLDAEDVIEKFTITKE